jgi:hypothetical protein
MTTEPSFQCYLGFLNHVTKQSLRSRGTTCRINLYHWLYVLVVNIRLCKTSVLTNHTYHDTQIMYINRLLTAFSDTYVTCIVTGV